MAKHALIAGAGIGGLSTALACSRAGWSVHLLEQAESFTGVGAGIQLGPNVVKRLDSWGLKQALDQVAAFPDSLEVKDGQSGDVLGRLRLGKNAVKRYGHPYATVHRAALHAVLLESLKKRDSIELSLQQSVSKYLQGSNAVEVHTHQGLVTRGEILIGADGLWSQVRAQMLNDGQPRFSGHLAYRALLPMDHLPVSSRSQNVTVWLGPKLHLVHYPVEQGQSLNIVAIVHGSLNDDPKNWNQSPNPSELNLKFKSTCTSAQDLVGAVPAWTRWALNDRLPVKGANELAQGRVALLGDAAHPMRPYLAQGAGMAIEDAFALGQILAGVSGQCHDDFSSPASLLSTYASERWRRNAQVQARSIRNGTIFHLSSPASWARNAAMKLVGERLLDLPWLYRG